MSAGFPNLFSPIKIGTKTARNRIVFPAHGVPALPFLGDGTEGSAYIAYQVARAKGGCALSVIGGIGCYDAPFRLGPVTSVPPAPRMLIPKLQRLADAVHEYNTLCLIQLYIFSDGFLNIPSNGTLGFSSFPTQMESVAEWQNMDDADLEKKVELFVKYAKICQAGGVDGIEIHACHGDLVQQSWSKWSNQRSDKWGQPMYFSTEIVSRMRAAVGQDFIICVRLTGDDFSYNGMGIEDNQKVAQALEATGKIDLLSVSFGSDGVSNAYTVAPMYIPAGSISIPLSSGIKQVVKSIPVIATSRINDPALAEKAIAEGHTDMVGLVRSQIADPEFANKAHEGRVEDIRLCIACNQGCWESEAESTCLQNAVVYKESTEFAAIKPAATKKKVMVIGAGPAGMEAARVAALRGHAVKIYEKANMVGGQINILSKAPGRDEFNQVTRYLKTQLDKLAVEIQLNTEATPETIAAEQPDTVIVATGAVPYILPVPGSQQGNVISPSQLLRGGVKVGEKVVVYESTGMQEGPTVADFLAEMGKKVELLTHFPSINQHWGVKSLGNGTHIPIIWGRLKRNGVIITPLTTIKEISGRTVTVTDTITGEDRIIQGVDTVVMANGYRAENRLQKALNGKIKELYAIGDCKSPRRALDAIHEGYMTAFSIGG
ncbi:MAG TPA: FAD-dependent oxidoreductase [Dehalococcoidales bacterium]|nr:FAD-dependent oxidoreductase [Dehalococcoidales bacterium]